MYLPDIIHCIRIAMPGQYVIVRNWLMSHVVMVRR